MDLRSIIYLTTVFQCMVKTDTFQYGTKEKSVNEIKITQKQETIKTKGNTTIFEAKLIPIKQSVGNGNSLVQHI